MANFEKVFRELIIIEGGYSDHQDDGGGITKYGITEETARRNGYEGDMRLLTLETAQRIYFKEYWEPYNFDLIQNSKVAGELFEFTVNTGSGHLASLILQRSYNVLNKNIQLTQDGLIGPKTASTINSYKFYKSLFKTMNIFQGMFYIALAESDKDLLENIKQSIHKDGNEKHKTFIRGWLDNRVSI